MEWKKERELNDKYNLSYLGSYEKVVRIMEYRKSFEVTKENIEEYNELCDFEIHLMKCHVNTMEMLNKKKY